MTVIMVTHDIKEAFALGTRLIALNHHRVDPQAPGRFGATVTYDFDLNRETAVPVLGFPKDRPQGRPSSRSIAMNACQPTRISRKAGTVAAASPRAPPSSRFQRPRDAGLEGGRGRGQALREGLAARAAMGARHGPARRRQPHRQVDPDLCPRRAAPFRRHQHLPQGALCRERPRRRPTTTPPSSAFPSIPAPPTVPARASGRRASAASPRSTRPTTTSSASISASR